MGIRCLFGHDFGGREVERDRREDGDEVVVAYRTVETCERCGSRRVISENKEIKPLNAAAEPAASPESASPTTPEPTPEADASSTGPQGEVRSTADDGADESSEPAAERETVAAPADDGADESSEPATERETVAAPAGGGGTTDASEDAAIIIDDAPAAPDDTPEAADDGDPSDPDLDAVVESESDTELLDDEETTAADDGETVVLDDGESDVLDDGSDADAAWPDADDDADDGFDAASPTEGGPTVAADDAGGATASWPESNGVERDSNGTKFVRPDTETPDRDEPTEFHCQNCGATRPSSASSLRSGDVCPECRKGYIAERRTEP